MLFHVKITACMNFLTTYTPEFFKVPGSDKLLDFSIDRRTAASIRHTALKFYHKNSKWVMRAGKRNKYAILALYL